MSYIETMERKYRNTGPYELPHIMTGWKWVERMIDRGIVEHEMTPRETFDLWLREGKLERVDT